MVCCATLGTRGSASNQFARHGIVARDCGLMDPSATLHSLFASAAWIRAFEVLPRSDGRWTVHCVVETDRSADDLRVLLNERAENIAALVDVRIVSTLSATPDACT